MVNKLTDAHRRAIRLADADLAGVMDWLDRNATYEGPDRRRTTRHNFRKHALFVRVQDPKSGEWTSCMVAARNLSAGGLSFLFDEIMKPTSKCRVRIGAHRGQWRDLDARVVHCRPIRAGVYEVGLAFDLPIDPGPAVEAEATT